MSNYSTIHHNSGGPKAKRFIRAIAKHDLTTAVETLEDLGYHHQLTQLFLLGWCMPSHLTGGGSDA